ncbi:C69 family dipeptidase [Natronoflexus pectinivorans]|uniref:Dipeptidase n=1 Tax=Natronoflexus pectinivorans TaxID=682526 RepID=A0A4R2GLI5_9BACT|nr:C69 family dipeptidase [Natronoflexus pectinivorans]TCO09178.1 dipeptidase [Natronoflexus pectinivorans]
MIKSILFFLLIFTSLPLMGGELVTIVVTNNASSDGSTIVAQFNIDNGFDTDKYIFQQRKQHAPNSVKEIFSTQTGEKLGEIPEGNGSFQVLASTNEHQLTIIGHNFSAKKELRNHKGILDGENLKNIALQRSKNARDAINLIDELTDKYGYSDDGFRFFIADPSEVWMMEMTGKGTMNRGAVWVARLIPDGRMAVHGTEPAIGNFPISSRNNDVLYSQDVISFAREMGYFDGRNRDFNFKNAYTDPQSNDENSGIVRETAGLFNATIQQGSDSLSLPLFFQPSQKVSLRSVKELTKNLHHREEKDSVNTDKTVHTFIAQLRNWLPRPIGGVVWLWVGGDSIGNFQPFYIGIDEFPSSFREKYDIIGEINRVYPNRNDSVILDETKRIRHELEEKYLRFAPAVEQTARALFVSNPALAVEYLTDYCYSQSLIAKRRWREYLDELQNNRSLDF